MADDIEEFRGRYRFLSNFFPASVKLDGCLYPSVEHAFQAAKTTDEQQRQPFQTGTAADAKRRGRTITLRPDWDTVRLNIMEDLLRQKFSGALRQNLLATGAAQLIEGNWWGDTFWGICKGVGQNHLGRLLMKIRAEAS